MSLEWAVFVGFWVGVIVAQETCERLQTRRYKQIQYRKNHPTTRPRSENDSQRGARGV